METLIIKNKTNRGDQAKQYFDAVGTCDKDSALIVRKYILNKKKKMPMMEPVKTFKGLTLHFQWFSIRTHTLNQVVAHFIKEKEDGPQTKAIELRSQFGDNAKYVVLEIMDEIKKFKNGGPLLAMNRLSFWNKVKQELEK